VSWDISANMNHQGTPSLTTYSVLNGLSYSDRLSQAWSATARMSRLDQDAGTGAEAIWQWTGGLATRPLPTLSAAFTYTGSVNETHHTTSNGLTAFARGDLYPGVSAQANASGNYSTHADSTSSLDTSASASASLVPNRFATLTLQGSVARSTTYQGSENLGTLRFARVDGSATVVPAPALTFSGSVGTILLGAQPSTVASFLASFSPLRGDLQLTASYSRNLNTAAQSVTGVASVSARWNIRRGVYWTILYSLLDLTSPVQLADTRTLTTTLTIAL
jgi:hypothetical protein